MRLALTSPSQAMTCEGMCFQKSTWYWAIGYLPPHSLGRWCEAPAGGWSFHKLGKPVFELAQPNVDDLDGEVEALRSSPPLLAEAGTAHRSAGRQRIVLASG